MMMMMMYTRLRSPPSCTTRAKGGGRGDGMLSATAPKQVHYSIHTNLCAPRQQKAVLRRHICRALTSIAPRPRSPRSRRTPAAASPRSRAGPPPAPAPCCSTHNTPPYQRPTLQDETALHKTYILAVHVKKIIRLRALLTKKKLKDHLATQSTKAQAHQHRYDTPRQ
jgi:hypothetical protein